MSETEAKCGHEADSDHDHAHGSGHGPDRDHDHDHGSGHGHGCDHGHGHSHDHRAASHKALWLALVILGVFFVVELVGGILTNSLALLSDAFHLLTDVAAVALALAAQWFAHKPSNAKNSFGYRRVEILAAQFNGFTLIVVAGYILYEAGIRLLDPPQVQSWPMIIVATVGLVAQLVTAMVLSRAKGESLNVKGAYLHAMTDALQSLGVIAAGLIMAFTGWYLADPLVSILLAVMVGWSGVHLLIEASHVLIEGTPAELDLDRIATQMQQTPGVSKVTDLHAWSLTSGYNALSAHVEAKVEALERSGGAEELRRRLDQALRKDHPIHHVTLQVELDCQGCEIKGCCGWLEGEGEHERKKTA